MNQEANQTARPSPWRALLGVALGLAALGTVLATFIVMQNNQDIRPVLIVTYCAFVAAGFYAPRAARKIHWIGAMAVALGGILPALALSMADLAFTDAFLASVLAAMAAAAAIVGVIARAFVCRGRLLLAGTLSGVALAVAIATATIAVPRLLDQRAYAAVDRWIEPFSVRTLDGEKIRSEKWRGRVVVLSYWATWCPPCLAEIPVISALQKKYKGDPRVAVVALNVGYGGDTAQKAREFLDHRHFDIATDIDDIIDGGKQGQAAISFGLKVVPTLFILNQNQRLVAVHRGFDSSEHLAATLSSRIDTLANASP